MRWMAAVVLAVVVGACALAPAAWAGESGPVAAGGNHNCAVRSDGHLQCWGNDYGGAVSGPNASTAIFTQVSAAPGFTCGIETSGKLDCWGVDNVGSGAIVRAANASPHTFAAVATGYQELCAATTGGQVLCWGSVFGTPPPGDYVQVGFNRNSVEGGYWGGNYECGLTTGGKLTCWGSDPHRYLPAVNASTDTFTQLSAGNYGKVCGLTTAGHLRCWGDDSYGSASGPTASTDTYTRVASGSQATCAIRIDGRLRCWGPSNLPWVLGPNTSTDTFTALSEELNDVCALKTNGRIECWGIDNAGSIRGANASGATYGYQPDSTPPVVAVPDPITAEATGPDGAAVEFSVSASDPDDAAGPVSCDHGSGSTFPLGTTTVTCSSTDTHGNTGSASFDVIVVDTTPPALSDVPTGISADATGPDGATVDWVAPTAFDLVDGAVPVDCLPAAGSLFPIGDTSVTCGATDAHGNAASKSFVVHVRGADEQLADLLAFVTGIGPGHSLAAKVENARSDLARGRQQPVCTLLYALELESEAQEGTTLTAAQVQAIDASAERIRAVVGC